MSLAKRLLARAGLPAFSVGASPSSVSGSSTSSTVSSGAATASAVGGSGSYSFAWARVSGSASISAVSASSAATTFQATGMSVGSLSATFACTVTDTVTSQVLVTNTVSVTLTRTAPSLSVSVSSPNGVGNSSGTITVTSTATASASGGTGSGYSYSWPDISGFSKSPSGSTCYYSCALGPGQSKFGSGTIYVTDSGGNSASHAFNIICENQGSPPPAFSVSVSPTSTSGTSVDGSGDIATEAVTASATGAVGSVTWAWALTSGVGHPISPSQANTQFGYFATVAGWHYGTFRVTGTDSLGRTATADVSASFFAYFPPPPP